MFLNVDHAVLARACNKGFFGFRGILNEDLNLEMEE